MARPRKLWSLDPRPDHGWIGRDHDNKDARGQAGRFIIAKLSETEGKTEDDTRRT